MHGEICLFWLGSLLNLGSIGPGYSKIRHCGAPWKVTHCHFRDCALIWQTEFSKLNPSNTVWGDRDFPISGKSKEQNKNPCIRVWINKHSTQIFFNFFTQPNGMLERNYGKECWSFVWLLIHSNSLRTKGDQIWYGGRSWQKKNPF